MSIITLIIFSEEKIKKLEKLRERKMKVMEKKKEESRIKVPLTDNTNANISTDSKVVDRNKTPSRRQKSVSVRFEDKTEVIPIPSKKSTATSENQPISTLQQKPNSAYPNERSEMDKSQNARSRSQLPLYNVSWQLD
jgi:hypothetical protein